MSEPNIDPSDWTKVASGEIAGNIYWERGFEALGNVASILSQFEELGDSEDIDWTMVIGDHRYFEPIRSADFPPLYNVRDFEMLLWPYQ
jgi:hypothetical protein